MDPKHASQTNATPVMDEPTLSAESTPDEVLDVAVEYTFPASDPLSIQDAYRHACEREEKK